MILFGRTHHNSPVPVGQRTLTRAVGHSTIRAGVQKMTKTPIIVASLA
jgi:hypothetical protein